MAKRSVGARFWAKVERGDGCWLWQGAIVGHGYGQFVRNGREQAHRVAWELANRRRVPEGMYVLHRCDNPPCVRPSHLFLGSQSDNITDCVAKGRHGARRWPERIPRGDRHGKAKLTEERVRDIRTASPKVSARELAERYGVTPTHIRSIRRGEGWTTNG